MSYSLDFRKHVFNVKEKNNLTFEQTSDRFGISIRTLFRWQERIEPVTKRNKPATKIDMKALEEDVRKYPDEYQYERAKKFQVSPNTILYALRRLGISHKKNSISSKSR